MKWLGSLLFHVACFGVVVWAQEISSVTSHADVVGTVVHSLTGKPLDGVHVRLIALGSKTMPTRVYGAITNSGGHFSIQGLEAANYIIVLDRSGFIRVPGKTGPARRGVVDLKSGGPQTLSLMMAPRPIINGRVVDEYGEPVPGVTITALPLSPQTMVNLFPPGPTTNDRGEFRLSVPPGRYYLHAQDWQHSNESTYENPEIRTDGSVEGNYLQTYYPSAGSIDTATPVEAQAGRELTGVEIHLVKSPVLSIKGTVSGIPDGVELLTVGMEWGASPSEISSATTSGIPIEQKRDAQGTFHLTHLSPGFYRIYVRCSAGDIAVQSQVEEVTLASSNVEDLHLVLSSGGSVNGTMEWSQGSAPKQGEKIRIRLQPLGSLNNTRDHVAEVEDDGHFAMKNVFAGRYRVAAEPLPEDGFVKTVLLDGKASLDGVLNFSHGADQAYLKVVLSSRGGQLSGRVEDADGSHNPLPSAVVLYPDGKEAVDPDALRFEFAGLDGVYHFHGLPPGNYRVLAVVTGHTMRYWRTEVLEAIQRFGDRVQRVAINEGDNLTINLKVPIDSATDETKR